MPHVCILPLPELLTSFPVSSQAHEIIALEILTLLLENPTDDSVEVAVGFLKEVGVKLGEVSPRGMHAIFERLRTVLHEGQIDKRVQYMVEVMFAVRKDGFKDHPAIIEGLDLVGEEEQFTHMLTLEDAVDPEDMLSGCPLAHSPGSSSLLALSNVLWQISLNLILSMRLLKRNTRC